MRRQQVAVVAEATIAYRACYESLKARVPHLFLRAVFCFLVTILIGLPVRSDRTSTVRNFNPLRNRSPRKRLDMPQMEAARTSLRLVPKG